MANKITWQIVCNRCKYVIGEDRKIKEAERKSTAYNSCPNCKVEFPQCSINEPKG